MALLVAFGALAFTGCQQTQEADDDDPEGTTVIKEETTVLPPDEGSGTDVDVEVRGGEEGVSGEAEVETAPPEN